jgi:NTE family protein
LEKAWFRLSKSFFILADTNTAYPPFPMKKIVVSLFVTFFVYPSLGQLPAKAPMHYSNLVLEGGGVRGFAYTGAFEILDSLGILKDIQRIGGSSAGAIQAMLVAVGYTPKEIADLATRVPLQKLNDGKGFLFGGSWRMTQQFGWYKGDEATKWIEECIAAKTGNGNTTFLDLHQQKGQKNYKDLYIVGADLSYQCQRILSYEQYPAMRIKDAVRISMSIPLYYEPVLMDDAGNVYESPQEGKTLHVMVDGGMLNNYPLNLFDSMKYLSAGRDTSSTWLENQETLGLLLEHPNQLAYQVKYGKNAPMPIDNLSDYTKALYATLVDRPNPENTGYYKLKRTIVINHLSLSPRVRQLSPEVVNDLVESGRKGVRVFFGGGKK